ncbi:hypothetical protein [Nocardioides pantholopis]|nr:hypothetical protein [Nocardioides pantholopis]
MTFLLLLLALSIVGVAMALRSVWHDDRGATPPPPSHRQEERIPSSPR